jgi:predicted DNA-binding protein (MmcQ/YjbR family)
MSFPEAIEQETWAHPTFRVRTKIFAGMGTGPLDISVPDEERSVGHTTMSMKAAPGEQELLLASGFPFFKPKYVGSKGWIGVVITDATASKEIRELVTDSYRTIAPRTLTRTLDD